MARDLGSILFYGFVLGVAATFIVSVLRYRSLVFDHTIYPGLAALRTVTWRARGVGLFLSVLAFFLVGGERLYFTAAPIAAILMIIAILAGQSFVYTKARTKGVAGLEHRRIRDYLPAWMAKGAAASLGLALAVFIWAWANATSDARGDYRIFAGTLLQWAWTPSSGWHISQAPFPAQGFPGSFYSMPWAVAVALMLGLAGAGLWFTAKRPRNASDPELVRVDDAIRRITAEGIVASVGLCAAWSLVQVAHAVNPYIREAAGYPDYITAETRPFLIAFWLLIAVEVAAGVASAWFAARVIVPGNGEQT